MRQDLRQKLLRALAARTAEEVFLQRILDDLKGVIKGELLFDDLSRILYSTDASIFQVQPLGVVVPTDEETEIARQTRDLLLATDLETVR